jgi:hypothetical protein
VNHLLTGEIERISGHGVADRARLEVLSALHFANLGTGRTELFTGRFVDLRVEAFTACETVRSTGHHDLCFVLRDVSSDDPELGVTALSGDDDF